MKNQSKVGYRTFQLRYCVDNPLAPAAPVVWLFCGTFWHVLATAILSYYTDYKAGFAPLIVVVIGLAYLGRDMRRA